jgi:hypothetical protein
VEVAILLEDRMRPLPDDVEIASDYGFITVRAKYTGQPGMQQVPVSGTGFVHGQHVIVRGEEEALKTWLKPFDVWVGRGPPILEQFDIMHIE